LVTNNPPNLFIGHILSLLDNVVEELSTIDEVENQYEFCSGDVNSANTMVRLKWLRFPDRRLAYICPARVMPETRLNIVFGVFMHPNRTK
jgi:hypothetical protein